MKNRARGARTPHVTRAMEQAAQSAKRLRDRIPLLVFQHPAPESVTEDCEPRAATIAAVLCIAIILVLIFVFAFVMSATPPSNQEATHVSRTGR